MSGPGAPRTLGKRMRGRLGGRRCAGVLGALFSYVDLPDDATLATGESLTVTYTFSVATDET